MTLFGLAVTLLAACSTQPAPAQPAATLTPTIVRTPAPTPTPTSTPTPEPPKSSHPGTLVYLTSHEPDTLDPHLDYTAAGSGVLQNIYEGLVTYDKSDPNKFVPLLSESIPEPSAGADGGVTYTWVIPSQIRFHNGDSLTAEDVAYSLWRSMLRGRSDHAGFESRTPGFLLLEAFFGVDDAAWLVDPSGKLSGDAERLRSAGSKALNAACEQVKSAVSFDNAARTVTLKLPHPYAPLLATLAGPWADVIDRTWAAQLGDWDGDCQTWQYFYGTAPDASPIYAKANGTGPYRLDSWTPGSKMVLVANPDFRLGAAKIRRAEIITIKDFDQRLSTLRSGRADLIEIDSAAERDRLKPLVHDECDGANGPCTTIDPNGLLRVYTDLPVIDRRSVFFNFTLPKGSPYAGSAQLDGQGVPLDFFADVHVRRAFNACFDRSAFITNTLSGAGDQPLALTLPDQPGYAGSPPAEFDLTRCADEFKAAEFKTADGQTLWDSGFALELPYRQGDTPQQAVVENLMANLAQVNARFVITPVAVSPADWLIELRTEQIPLAVIGWQEDFHDPHNWYRPYFLDTYVTQFHLPEELAARYRDGIERGAAELDTTARAAIYRDLNTALHDDASVILLPYGTQLRYEPVYLTGWQNSLSANPLVLDPGYLYDYRDQ